MLYVKFRHSTVFVSLVAFCATAAYLFAQADTVGENRATFHAVPVASPYYGLGAYPVQQDPANGYLSGAASVISSQAQYMVATQQAYLMKEQVNQAKLETRRKSVDEYMYE